MFEPIHDQVAAPSTHRCQECPAEWTDDSRWRAFVTDDEPAELVFYCPSCAYREFGGPPLIFISA